MLSVFRPIAPHLAGRVRPLAGAAAMAVLASSLALVPYLVAYRLIGLAFAGDAAALREALAWLLGIAASGVVARSLLAAAASFAAHAAAFALLADLRRAAAAKLARIPLGFFDRQESGRLKTVLREDIDKLEDAFAHAVPDIVTGFATPLLMATVLLFVDWRMTVALTATVPVLAWLYVRTMRAKRDLIVEYGGTLARFNAQAVEVVRGIKVLKAYGGAPRALTELLGTVDRIAAINEAAERISLKPWVGFLVSLRATLLIVVPIGMALSLAGSLDPVTFLFFVLMSLIFNQPLLGLVYTASGFVWKVHLAGRNFGWLMDVTEIVEPVAPRRPGGDTIAFEGVGLAYGGKTVLTDVSFTVRSGTMTALVGHSGVGKSSLARLVARFAEPAAGRVTIGGTGVAEIAEADLLGRIAIVFQETFLFDDSIYENIRMGRPEASPSEIREAARRALVTDFAQALPDGLDARIGDNGNRLSGGQRQRVAIARALVKDAPIVLLDEATASLDPESEAQVLAALAELAVGRTILVIAHRLPSVRSADQVVFLHGGGVAALGRHDDLVRDDPVYAAYWREREAAPDVPPTGRVSAARTPSASADSVSAPLGAGGEEPLPGALSVTRDVGSSSDSAAPRAIGRAFWRDLLALLGPARKPLLRRAVPLIALETMVASVPVFVALAAIAAMRIGTLTAWQAFGATALLVVAYGLSGLLTYAAQSVLFHAQREAVSALQRRVIRHMMQLPLGYFQGAGGNAVSGLFATHLGQLDLVTPPTLLVRAIAMPAVAAMFLLWLDWRLGLAALAGVPAFVGILLWNGREQATATRALLACRERANALTLEYLIGLPVVRSYRLVGERLPRFSQAIEDEMRLALAATRPLAIVAALGPATLELGFVAILALGGLLFAGGNVAVETFTTFVVLGLVFYRPMFDVIELVAYGRSLAGHIGAIDAVLAVPAMPDPEHAAAPGGHHGINFHDVSFGYGENHGGLRGVSFEAREGHVTAVVGPSGAGKSTLLALIGRFWDPEGGRIEIGGRDLRELSLRDLHADLSIVFQDAILFRDTVRANIALGCPGASDAAIESAARAACIHETISTLSKGYDTILGESGATLSGGERQRLCLARALLKDTPVVLLDEAITAIDPDGQHEIRAAIARVCAGKTVVVVSHDLASVQNADHIVVLDRGRVAMQGRHTDLMARGGLYARLWAIQAQTRDQGIRAAAGWSNPESTVKQSSNNAKL